MWCNCVWRGTILSCEFVSCYRIFIATGRLNLTDYADFHFHKDFESCSKKKKRYSVGFLQVLNLLVYTECKVRPVGILCSWGSLVIQDERDCAILMGLF